MDHHQSIVNRFIIVLFVILGQITAVIVKDIMVWMKMNIAVLVREI
jgi:hypothetical protein